MEIQSGNPLDLKSKLTNGLFIVGGILTTYFIGKKVIATINKNSTQNAVDDSPSVRQASILRSAMNRSGITWLKSADGTNEQVVLETAATITNLDEVISAYKNLYQDNLLDDLQSELSTDDYQKFLTLVSSNKNKKGGKAPTQFAKAENLIVAKKQVVLRSSPDATNHGAVYEVLSTNNIIRTANAGEFLGYATGKQQFDSPNNVKFIEVGFVINGSKAPANLKAQNKKQTTFWVSSSANYVDVFTYYKDMFDQYPLTKNYTSWMKPLNYFLSGFDNEIKVIGLPRLITKARVAVLDDHFQTIAIADSNTILGQMLMSLVTTKNERYYKFKTVDNTERWVKANNVTKIER